MGYPSVSGVCVVPQVSTHSIQLVHTQKPFPLKEKPFTLSGPNRIMFEAAYAAVLPEI